jgi:hypothetical protein
MTVARNTSCSDWSRIPWPRRTLRAYSRLVHDVKTLVTWSTAVSWSFTWTPRTRRQLTRSMFKHGSGSCIDFPRLPRTVKISFFDLPQFNFILLSEAHFVNSLFHPDTSESYGWYNQVSSANSKIRLPIV